jgi:hypothetical protein
MASSLGFHYLGNALPRSFPVAGTGLDRMISVHNVIDAEPRGTRIIAFDCKFGEGKGSWRRTVIAAQTGIGNVSRSSFGSDVEIEQNQNWVIIWRPKKLVFDPTGLMPIAELGAHLETL